MARHFSPAQLALFRSALSLLAEGIIAGDKGSVENNYSAGLKAVGEKLSGVNETRIEKAIPEKGLPVISQPSPLTVSPSEPQIAKKESVAAIVVEPVSAARNIVIPDSAAHVTPGKPVIAPAKESAKPKPKKSFSWFSWFSKKEKPADSSGSKVKGKKGKAAAAEAVAASSKRERRTPSNPALVNSFFAGLPWAEKKLETASVPAKLVQPKEANLITLDSRSVAGFFSGLPWAVKDKRVAKAPNNQRVNSFFSNLPWAAKAEVPGRIVVSVHSFFGGLPWLNKTDNAVESPLTSDLEAKQEQASLPKTITIDRKSASPSPISRQENADFTVVNYFSGLPWSEAQRTKSIKTAVSETQLAPDVTVQTGNKVDFASVPSQPVSSFFSNLPWQQQKDVHAHIQSNQRVQKPSLPEGDQTTQLESLQPSGFASPVDRYFESLPWQKKPTSKGAESFSISGSGSGDSGMFAAATQSALRASQKGERVNLLPENKSTDKFFSSLPWNGKG